MQLMRMQVRSMTVGTSRGKVWAAGPGRAPGPRPCGSYAPAPMATLAPGTVCSSGVSTAT